jgi:hypothetical protein
VVELLKLRNKVTLPDILSDWNKVTGGVVVQVLRETSLGLQSLLWEIFVDVLEGRG